MSQLRIIIITLLSLIAFAANSLITRLALEATQIDEASFIAIRLVSGALFLWLFLLSKNNSQAYKAGSWFSAFSLFIYAACFTYGYGLIAAGSGALILFGSVQITMTIIGYKEGERLNSIQCFGFFLAILGLIILMLPGITAPSFSGAVLMSAAGIAWGFYTLQGRGETNPASATAGNFIKAAPMSITLWLLINIGDYSTYNVVQVGFIDSGVCYALLSGIVTSGIGYIIWYSVLPELKASQAAIIQLSVPILVTLAGTFLLNEVITLRIFIASFTLLLGTFLVLNHKTK
ncbi:MAG: DMT family transporter [Colwellia sp.]|nr:DMT family transporter [Colwellia sp.]